MAASKGKGPPMPDEVNLSVVAFAFGLSHIAWPVTLHPLSSACWLRQIGQMGGIFAFGKLIFPKDFAVWWRAALLGCTFSQGLYMSLSSTTASFMAFGTYVAILSSFHYLEYAVTGLTNPSNLSTDSFLLNHSKQYWMAAAASWIEYFTELYFVPSMKSCLPMILTGLAVCLVGEVLRKLAMFHAGRSFNHIVQSVKRQDHVLVTDGVFGYMRHPSYAGWILWSVGTQIVLGNPVCILAYSYVSWAFFHERIAIEEYTLLQFFGEDYEKYQKKVPTGIPFIKGYPATRFMTPFDSDM